MVSEKNILKLNIAENAYDFLNCALEYVVKAKNSKSKVEWKHALLNLTLSLELFLKERLRREYPLLIYANIDKYRQITEETKTVSMDVLIERIKYVIGEEEFERMDAGRTNLAQKIRNQILHYETKLEFPQVYHDFANLMNFVRIFFDSELKKKPKETLYDHMRINLWKEEESLIAAFEEDIVYYNNIFMAKELKDEIIEEQTWDLFIFGDESYCRIPYGDAREWEELVDSQYYSLPCHDCSVIKGQIHLFDCDVEKCPKCGEQFLCCKCVNDPKIEKYFSSSKNHKLKREVS